MPDDPTAEWWLIREDEILTALHRVHDGEDPDLLFAEMYANAPDVAR